MFSFLLLNDIMNFKNFQWTETEMKVMRNLSQSHLLSVMKLVIQTKDKQQRQNKKKKTCVLRINFKYFWVYYIQL